MVACLTVPERHSGWVCSHGDGIDW